MKCSPETWLGIAAKLMPPNRSDWFEAMEAELEEITDPYDRRAFAQGCFKTAIIEFARSPKGLSYIARAFGAAFIFMSCMAGIYLNSKTGALRDTGIASILIISLCLFYMCGAVLLLTSLKKLKTYSSIGFLTAFAGWLYCVIKQPAYEPLPIEFLTAINLEAAGLMGGLYISATFLAWLYNPKKHDA